jgi:mannose-6-phosphate isomerase-like protein (cupin superfamily)
LSYPEPRYHGEGGEVSATYRPADHTPELVNPVNGTTVGYLATGASTDGLFGLYRYEMGPAPGGPGPHFHRTIAESFYVLGGSLLVYDGRRWVETRPGDFLHVPPGGIHGFRNESGEPVSMLLHFAPGAPREAYFEGNVDFMVKGKPGEEELAEFYRRHDNIWL